MKISTNSILFSLGVIGSILMTCLAVTMLAVPLVQADQPEVNDPAATIQAIVTQTVYVMTQTAPTATPIPPTATSIPATNTPLPTATAVSYCDWVTFVKDVTIPDGTKFLAGETFTKTWRLQNRGTCTWTADYMLVFVNGDPMGSTTAVRLPGNVYPGQIVDVSVTLTAPAKRGHYVGYWMLRNPAGTLVGYGDNANRAFYVEIRTEDLPRGTVTGNFQYPSEFNPPLILYFENAVTREVIQFSIPEKNFTYSVLLPNGTYYAYAWAPGYNLQGAYVHDNLIMKTFVVKGGQNTSGIHLTDWSPYPHSYGP